MTEETKEEKKTEFFNECLMHTGKELKGSGEGKKGKRSKKFKKRKNKKSKKRKLKKKRRRPDKPQPKAYAKNKKKSSERVIVGVKDEKKGKPQPKPKWERQYAKVEPVFQEPTQVPVEGYNDGTGGWHGSGNGQGVGSNSQEPLSGASKVIWVSGHRRLSIPASRGAGPRDRGMKARVSFYPRLLRGISERFGRRWRLGLILAVAAAGAVSATAGLRAAEGVSFSPEKALELVVELVWVLAQQ